MTDYKEALKKILLSDWKELAYWDEATVNGERFETVHIEHGENRRWSRTNAVTVKLPDGTYVQFKYEEGLTETQEDYGPGEYYPIELVDVEPVEKTIITYEPIK